MSIPMARYNIIPAVLQMRHIAPKVAAAAANWWESGGATGCVAAYQPKGAASYAVSLVNLANPGTYDATEGTAPAWASGTGWTFTAASSQYLITTIVPASGYSSLVQYASATFPSGGTVYQPFGRRTGSNTDRYGVQCQTGTPPNGDIGYLSGGQVNVAYTPLPAAGNVGIAGQHGYRNGVADGGAIGAWGTNGTAAIYIGCRNTSSGGSPSFYFNGAIIALAIYSATLTADQVSAVATAMAAL